MLVVNTSATVPGQLDGTRDGSAVVVHVANRLGRRHPGGRVAHRAGRRRPGARRPAGERIDLPGGGVVELIAAYPELRASGIVGSRGRCASSPRIASGSSPTGVGQSALAWPGHRPPEPF